ncbi:caspase family protein [Flectobacillus roseus]
MKKRFLYGIFFLMSLSGFAQSPASKPLSKKVALLVGMEGIKGFSPDKDLTNMQKKLKSLGFTVQVIKPKSEEEFKNEVADFELKYKETSLNMTLFYFTGYGFTRNQQSYLRFDSTFNSTVELNTIKEHLPYARDFLLIFDIGLPSTTNLYTKGLNVGVLNLSNNITFFIGCSRGEMASTLPSGEGVFTQAIITSLKEGMTIDSFVNEASIQTVRLVNSLRLSNQQPEIHKIITLPSLFEF